MDVAYYELVGAFLRMERFSNLTFGKLKNLFTNFRSNTSLNPPLLFSTKKLLDTYYYFLLGHGIYTMAPEDM